MKYKLIITKFLSLWCSIAISMDCEQYIPKKFDELEPIKVYNPDAIPVIHPAYKQRAAQDPDFTLVVPLIQHVYDQCDNFHKYEPAHIFFYAARFLDKDPAPDIKKRTEYTETVRSHRSMKMDNLMFHVRETYDSSLMMKVSIQTYYALVQTYLQIMHGQYVDLDDSRLRHNPSQENINNETLKNLLPPIIQKLITPDSNSLIWRNILIPIFNVYILKQKESVLNNIEKVSIHTHSPHSVIQYLHCDNYRVLCSPQSIVQADQELNAFIDMQPIVYTPYDKERERANYKTIVQHFPDELFAAVEEIDNSNSHMWYHYKKLVFYAYRCRYPKHGELLCDDLWDIRWHIKWNISQILNRHESFCNSLADQFIQTFENLRFPAPVYNLPVPTITDPCYETLKKRLSPEKNTEAETILTNAYKQIMDAHKSKKLDTEKLYELIIEELPKCPICLELFDDQFSQGKKAKDWSYVAIKLIPCKHALCSACKLTLPNQICPLCRAPFQ